MNYFDSSYSQPNQTSAPINTSSSNTAQLPTFRDDYNGIINGLMSTVQLGYTSVSLVYFYKTIKKFFDNYIRTLLKEGKVFLSNNHPKYLIAFVLKRIWGFFRITTTNMIIAKLSAIVVIAFMIRYYLAARKREIELKKKIVDKAKTETNSLKSSEEFWQKYFPENQTEIK